MALKGEVEEERAGSVLTRARKSYQEAQSMGLGVTQIWAQRASQALPLSSSAT